MSISPSFFRKLEERGNLDEIFYYEMRCEYNTMLSKEQGDEDGVKKFIEQTNQLNALGFKIRHDPNRKYMQEDARKAKSENGKLPVEVIEEAPEFKSADKTRIKKLPASADVRNHETKPLFHFVPEQKQATFEELFK